MSDLQLKLVEVITQLQGVVKDNAADAVNLGLASIRIDNIFCIFGGALLLMIGLFCAYFFFKDEHKEIDGLLVAFGIPSIVFGFILFFNIWNWVAIFQPKLWLAHQILSKAVG